MPIVCSYALYNSLYNMRAPYTVMTVAPVPWCFDAMHDILQERSAFYSKRGTQSMVREHVLVFLMQCMASGKALQERSTFDSERGTHSIVREHVLQ